MSGLPLNHQLDRTRRPTGAQLPHRSALSAVCVARRTAAAAWAHARREPGASIEVEVWELPIAALGSFRRRHSRTAHASARRDSRMAQQVKGFLCEAHATAEARDITEFGGWRQYLARQHAA